MKVVIIVKVCCKDEDDNISPVLVGAMFYERVEGFLEVEFLFSFYGWDANGEEPCDGGRE